MGFVWIRSTASLASAHQASLVYFVMQVSYCRSKLYCTTVLSHNAILSKWSVHRRPGQCSSSHGTPWRIHGQYHRKFMGIHMDIRGNTMDYSWSIPWIVGIRSRFVKSTIKNPWNSHGFSMYFPWSIHGISSVFFNPWDFHGQIDGFSKYGHVVSSMENLWI